MRSLPRPIVVVGLGPGDPALLTVAARDVLRRSAVVVARIADHPALDAALTPDASRIPCDDLYERHERFSNVYRAIAERVVDLALGRTSHAGGPAAGSPAGGHGDDVRGSSEETPFRSADSGGGPEEVTEGAPRPVVYAVPGDPAVGETSVVILRRLADEAGLRVRIISGVSFIGPTLGAVGWDALDGVQIADATDLASMHHPHLDPDRPALVAQVYSRMVAADVKLVLLNQYPEDHPVIIVRGAASADRGAAANGMRSVRRPLAELDHLEEFDDVTTLAVPALPAAGSLLTLAEVVAHLRAPDGCPWDREQTHRSLRPYLIEEAYEAVTAIDRDGPAALAEELGDVLLQVVLHAQIGVESGTFALRDVIRQICEKLVRRHPHVFGDVEADTADEVLRNWDRLKASERRERGEPADPLAGVPPDLPALMRAQQVQRKGRATVGEQDVETLAEEWEDAIEMLRSVKDEGGTDHGGALQERRHDRIGGLLWSVTALARRWEVDAESALREATQRFEQQVRAASAERIGVGSQDEEHRGDPGRRAADREDGATPSGRDDR